VRGPHREVGALLSVDFGHVSAEFLEEPVVVAFVEKMKIVAGQQRRFFLLGHPGCRHSFSSWLGLGCTSRTWDGSSLEPPGLTADGLCPAYQLYPFRSVQRHRTQLGDARYSLLLMPVFSLRWRRARSRIPISADGLCSASTAH